METIQLIYFGFIHAIIIVSLLSSVLLLIGRKRGERARKVLAVVWIIIDILFIMRLIQMYTGSFQYDYILPIEPLLGGLATIILLTLYPAEVIHPGWLRPRTLLLMFSPLLVLEGVVRGMHFYGVEFQRYESLPELLDNASEPQVWIRFILMIVIYGYSFSLFLIPRKTPYGNADRKWILYYCWAVQGIAVFYAFNMLTGMYPSGVFHLIYCLFFIVYTTYQELNQRLFIPSSRAELVQEVPAEPDDRTSEAELESTISNLLWQQLEMYMHQQRPWLNPDLTLPILASAVCSNRTTLSALIRSHGYDSFYDYVAAYRIDAFCRMADRNEVVTIQEAFFVVGFRSRATAFSQFRKRKGISPSDYLKNSSSKSPCITTYCDDYTPIVKQGRSL